MVLEFLQVKQCKQCKTQIVNIGLFILKYVLLFICVQKFNHKHIY